MKICSYPVIIQNFLILFISIMHSEFTACNTACMIKACMIKATKAYLVLVVGVYFTSQKHLSTSLIFRSPDTEYFTYLAYIYSDSSICDQFLVLFNHMHLVQLLQIS